MYRSSRHGIRFVFRFRSSRTGVARVSTLPRESRFDREGAEGPNQTCEVGDRAGRLKTLRNCNGTLAMTEPGIVVDRGGRPAQTACVESKRGSSHDKTPSGWGSYMGCRLSFRRGRPDLIRAGGLGGCITGISERFGPRRFSGTCANSGGCVPKSQKKRCGQRL